jgi:hypothetical protein
VKGPVVLPDDGALVGGGSVKPDSIKGLNTVVGVSVLR